MKIAIASCMCTKVFKNQPVWAQIAAEKPDFLVLLGDSIYLDIHFQTHPQQLDEDGFARLQHSLYAELLAQKQFAALVRGLPPGRVFSVWDDHDFLWNDAIGAELAADPAQSGKIHRSAACQEAFRAALARGLAPGSFPAQHDDPVLLNPQRKPLSTPSVVLADDIRLHLCDLRTWRTRTWLLEESKRTLLGAAQRKRIEAAIKAAPEALHLIASSSTLAGWKRYKFDLDWLFGLAAEHRSLVLSGDVHRNEVDGFHTGGFPLHEATSSGAAVRDAVFLGQKQQNFGLIEIDANTVRLSFMHLGQPQSNLARTFDRRTWLPI